MNENVMDFHFFNAKINIFEIRNRVYVLVECTHLMLKIFISRHSSKLMLIRCRLEHLSMHLFKFTYGLLSRLIGKVFEDIVLKFLMLVLKKTRNKTNKSYTLSQFIFVNSLINIFAFYKNSF